MFLYKAITIKHGNKKHGKKHIFNDQIQMKFLICENDLFFVISCAIKLIKIASIIIKY